MIKMIFSDMDGTLLDENGQLPKDLGKMLARLKEKGVIFAAASGRQYQSLLKQFAPYKDDMLFVTENGNYVADSKKEIYSATIEPELVREILHHAETLPVKLYPVLCGKKMIHVPAGEPKLMGEVKSYDPLYEVTEDLYNVDDEILKISIADLDEKNSFANCCQQFAKFKDKVDMTISSDVWSDFMPRNSNKGNSIRQLQQKLNIKPEECAAFGDYLNDLEMMDAVYYSYAMENAHPDLKAKARFQAKSNKENGVLTAIDEFFQKGLI